METDASQNMADGTLSPNSRELEDGEVIDVTELSLKDMASPRMSSTSWMLTMYHQAWSTKRNRPLNK
jgi:hypothetical protein